MTTRSTSKLNQELIYCTSMVRLQPTSARAYVRRGMARFKLGEIQGAIADFDYAEQLEPAIAPYLWQRGLAYYYAERYDDGIRQFERDLHVNAHDVEETLWRYLCIAQSQGFDQARATLLPWGNDSRPIMRPIYDLFAGQSTPEAVLKAGQQLDPRAVFYAYLYLGLYAEAQHDPATARQFIHHATHDYAFEDDYMWHLAWVHQQIRGG